MSTVVVVNGANGGFPQNPSALPPSVDHEQQKKDPNSTRMACGAFGVTALVGGIAGQIASCNAADKFVSIGKSGKIFDEKITSYVNPKSWGRSIKANPKAFLGYIGLEIASWTSLLVGAALVQRAFTGHKAEKKKDKS